MIKLSIYLHFIYWILLNYTLAHLNESNQCETLSLPVKFWLIIAAPVIRFTFSWSLIDVCRSVSVCVGVCRSVSECVGVCRSVSVCVLNVSSEDVGTIKPSSAFLSHLILIVDVWIQLPNNLFLCWSETLTSCQFQVSSRFLGCVLKSHQSVIKLLLVSRWLFVVDPRTELSLWYLGFFQVISFESEPCFPLCCPDCWWFVSFH